MSEHKCPFCQQELDYLAEDIYGNMYCPNCRDKNGFTYKASESIWQELIRIRKALDKGMEHITGLNNMIESWYKLLQSDKDASTKYAILKSAISAYVENKGGDNEL